MDMQNIKLFIPESHLNGFEEMLSKFSIMLISKIPIPGTDIIEDKFYQIEILTNDYSMLYFLGYAVGGIQMNAELSPILNSCQAMFLSMVAKVKELEYMKQVISDYEKEVKSYE